MATPRKDGQKPMVGQVITVQYLRNGTTMTGPVLKFIVDNEQRWKVEIEVQKIEGAHAYNYLRYLGEKLMFEHYDLVSMQPAT